mgnify:CR=1 FL=1
MTYSTETPHNQTPIAADPAQTDAAYSASISPMVTAIILRLLHGLAALKFRNGSGRFRNSAKAAGLFSAIAVIMACQPGTVRDKIAFLKDLCAVLGTRLDRIYKRYLIWRQRKCWLWGGGPGHTLPARQSGTPGMARDRLSFDALIPD